MKKSPSLDNLENLKNVITSRIYYSSIVNSVKYYFIEETPYNILNIAIQQSDSGNMVGNMFHNTIAMQYTHMEFFTAMIAFLFCVQLLDNRMYHKSFHKLDSFIDRTKIEGNTKKLFFIFMLIFTKNVENAI